MASRSGPFSSKKFGDRKDLLPDIHTPTECQKCQILTFPSMVEESHDFQADDTPRKLKLLSPEDLWQKIPLKTTNTILQLQEKTEESLLPSTNVQVESHRDKTSNFLKERVGPTSESVEREGLSNTKKMHSKDREEEELQQLVLKLKDTLSVQVQAGQPSAAKVDLYFGAREVSKAFSNLIHQITITPWK